MDIFGIPDTHKNVCGSETLVWIRIHIDIFVILDPDLDPHENFCGSETLIRTRENFNFRYLVKFLWEIVCSEKQSKAILFARLQNNSEVVFLFSNKSKFK